MSQARVLVDKASRGTTALLVTATGCLGCHRSLEVGTSTGDTSLSAETLPVERGPCHQRATGKESSKRFCC